MNIKINSNKEFEGKINKIPGIEHNLNNFFFENRINSKDYIIGINIYNNSYIIISIAFEEIDRILVQKFFTFEGIEKFDPEFFKPFNKNILILFKFIIRLLLSKLIVFKKIQKEDKHFYYLILNCLKDSSLRPITIDLNNDAKEINIDSAPVVNNNNKGNTFKMNDNNNKANENYKIELSKHEYKYENSEIYKEIEIKFTNINESKVYYKYLDYLEIFDLSFYYFNGSIEDIYDDLNIIIYHNNYKFEKHNHSIKFFFQVFNIIKRSTEPYTFIFIKALDKERAENELQIKMKKYFQSIVYVGKYSEKKENIDEHNKEKAIDDNKNINNEKKEQKDINESNKYKEKNKLVEKEIIINEQNIKNNSKDIFDIDLIEKENMTYKNNSFFMKQKRLTNNTIDNFLIKRKKNEENNEFNFKNINKNNNNNKNDNYNNNDNNDNNYNNYNNNYNNYNNNNNNNNNNDNNNNNNIYFNNNNANYWIGGSQLSDSNNDTLKKSINNSLELKEKKENKKLNKDKFQKENNKKSKNKSMNFKLDENGRYNINIDEVIHNYLQLLYMHPLDNDEEIKKIKNEDSEDFYLCTICDIFFKSRDSVREHQWKEHLKPFGEIIQKELKSQNQNKSN